MEQSKDLSVKGDLIVLVFYSLNRYFFILWMWHVDMTYKTIIFQTLGKNGNRVLTPLAYLPIVRT